MNYYIYRASQEGDLGHYIFKSNENNIIYPNNFHSVKILYTFNNSRDINMVVSPPVKDCKKLEIHEMIAYRMLYNI